MLVTFRIAERRRARGTIALASFFLAAQLGKKIAARQLKQRIRWIFLGQRADYFQRAIVLLIVVVKVDGQIKPRFRWNQYTFFDSVLELADAFLLVPARNTHEKSQDACSRRERIDVIVVKT